MSVTSSAPGPEPGVLPIRPGVAIPRSELTYRATRSGGPGGQHVNKTASRVEVTWTPATSQGLTPDQRERIIDRLANRLDTTGTLRLVSDRTRSQLQNKEDVTERLAELLRAALTPRKVRRPTKVSKTVKARRLETKRRHGAKKADRRRRNDD
ncbi:MAG TPA: alternative ribosome rescue aminoacyl-tRNA hydrolase ArfB [Gemmatimonadales bacterium]|nr:alternative ribosome rescue aminoacyl-tRNA hydrolase ArfB [Gemmatimonadales bacterium]